ncbi:methyltransferase domain-containing protein [Roseibium sp. RKSG952]|uniref:methyltransferase domain-containing protein n=1 Tax=Roseibium sp. RKSG952 TaxID=2529384 RepID=UPI0012BCA755|nr:methyltransferase domain-containing protein [Roseibium sp. RKSG952]MTH98963.1 methyltransferase domain-containing protein [Roseibium sp. RKSG952]
MGSEFGLKNFTALETVDDIADYIHMLEAFDGIPQLRELKILARSKGGIGPGKSVLDVGCGFGLETFRLARAIQPGGQISGIDRSTDFITEARTRAADLGLPIDFRIGDAQALPFDDDSFDCVRAERILIYLDNYGKAVSEMHRVLKPGGHIALLEPDFTTLSINLDQQPTRQKVLQFEADTAVRSSCLPGPLWITLQEIGFEARKMDSRVLVLPQKHGGDYMKSSAVHAADAGVISTAELDAWTRAIDHLVERKQLFATVGYFLFTARREP